jgi:hypothetical protein
MARPGDPHWRGHQVPAPGNDLGRAGWPRCRVGGRQVRGGPPSYQELAGEVTAVAAFVLATSQRPTHSARAWRVRAIAAGIAASAVVAFSGAAAANALPAPIQELAHTTFDAPAPRPPAPLPRATPPAGKLAPMPSPSSTSQQAKAKAPKAKANKAPEAK